MGPVHFVQLNSEQHIQPKSKQVVWLENDLKALDRTQFPWVVVSMHRWGGNTFHSVNVDGRVITARRFARAPTCCFLPR